MPTLPPKTLSKLVGTARWTALGRAGLDVRAIGSWDRQLERSPRLLVPVDVQALVVPAEGKIEAVPTAATLPTPDPAAGPAAALPIPPEPFGDPAPRPAGVHLHWALPDGLTRGDSGVARAGTAPAGNPGQLPPVADRWLVVRLVHGQAAARAWIVLADRGEHADLAGWTEPGPLPAGTATGASGRRAFPRERLTAVSGGDPAWAATYDAVVDRFAFHDPLDDVPADAWEGLTLSYLVAGWWSDPALDPLHDCTSLGAYHDRTRWLGWLAPDPAGLADEAASRGGDEVRRASLSLGSPPMLGTGPRAEGADGPAEVTLAAPGLLEEKARLWLQQGPAVPRQTLLHGSIQGVGLTIGKDLAPRPQSLQVAVGPTPYAALSALLADGAAEARASSERALAAFASNLLATIDAPGGLAAVDEDRHASAFTAVAGGVRARPDRIGEGDPLAKDRPAPETPEKGKGAGRGAPAEKDERTAQVRLVRRDRRSVTGAAREARFPEEKAPRSPRSFRDVAVPLPRAFTPADLSFVIRGAVRSFRHGGDGRFTAQGQLACRLPPGVVSGIEGLLDQARLPPGLQGLGSGAVPPEVDALLRELVMTDPYRWREQLAWASDPGHVEKRAVERRLKAEHLLRMIAPSTRGQSPELTDDAADALRRASLYQGDDASPVAVTRWIQPWVPLWCDWALDVRVDDALDRCALGPIDLERAPGAADPGATRTVTGRALLTSASARALASRIKAWLSQEDARDAAGQGQVSEGIEAELSAAAAAAEGLDVLGGSCQGLRQVLLGLDPVDAARALIQPDGTPTTKPLARALPLLLAGGRAELKRLRVVDAFGRYLDVPDAALRGAELATTLLHPDGAPALALPPRLQRASRLLFRFVDPRTPDGQPEVDARVDQQHPEQAVSPVAGFLLPDHVDEALEAFDAAGNPLGQLMHDPLTGAVVWEGAPGRLGPVGGPPDPGVDPGARHVTRLAAGLVAADAAARNGAAPPAESALQSLLRAVDTTLWTVDPLGSMGTAAVAGLVGRPIAVVRATLRLQVLDDLDALAYATPADRAARAAAYADLAARAFTVRLGELTRSDDGLLAYAVDDDYSRLRLVAPEVRSQARASGRMRGQLSVYARGSEDDPAVTPIDHPYVNGPTDLGVHAGQTVRLTLLLMPGGKVHATSGILPRKALALARDWFHDAVVRLSPSFRVGPVLVEPDAIRLPLVTGLGDRQTFTRRDTPLTWKDDPIAAATQSAYLPDLPHVLEEGWIRVVQETGGRKLPGEGGGKGGAP